MYQYVKLVYEQWQSGQDANQTATRAEDFIDLVHRTIGYDKDILRGFLHQTEWFKYKLDI